MLVKTILRNLTLINHHSYTLISNHFLTLTTAFSTRIQNNAFPIKAVASRIQRDNSLRSDQKKNKADVVDSAPTVLCIVLCYRLLHVTWQLPTYIPGSDDGLGAFLTGLGQIYILSSFASPGNKDFIETQ